MKSAKSTAAEVLKSLDGIVEWVKWVELPPNTTASR